jgi:protein-disulfide isomerase
MRLLKLIALLMTLSFAQTAYAAPPARPAGWATTVQITPSGGHLYGNPRAKLRIVEYVSYTCPHCAHFTAQSTQPLWQKYLPAGTVSVEVRHLVRDPIDMTAAALANCGPPAKFEGNNVMFFSQQARWIAPIGTASEAKRKRWEGGEMLPRLKAIAADFGFYAMMQSRGYTRGQVDACLADGAMLKRLAAETQAGEKLGIDSTPSFMLNGALLSGTYDWASLEMQLQARL